MSELDDVKWKFHDTVLVVGLVLTVMQQTKQEHDLWFYARDDGDVVSGTKSTKMFVLKPENVRLSLRHLIDR